MGINGKTLGRGAAQRGDVGGDRAAGSGARLGFPRTRSEHVHADDAGAGAQAGGSGPRKVGRHFIESGTCL